MAKIYGSLTELIGNTPLIELKNFGAKRQVGGKVIAKVEYFNPLGSVKDLGNFPPQTARYRCGGQIYTPSTFHFGK